MIFPASMSWQAIHKSNLFLSLLFTLVLWAMPELLKGGTYRKAVNLEVDWAKSSQYQNHRCRKFPPKACDYRT